MGSRNKSDVAEFFAGKNVFLTGSTGFVGKAIVYKFLQSCPNINKIYLLMREKKGISPSQRFTDYTKHLIFTNLLADSPDIFRKLHLVKGDVLEDGLGLDELDKKELVENVNVVIHCAATVKFTLPLRESVEFNVKGTFRLLELAKEMTKLVSFVHVSTAYCQQIGVVLEEREYPTEYDPLKVIRMTEVMDEPCMELIRPQLMRGNHSNTYTYTKSLAEVLVKKYENVLPVAIARPSIILCAKAEPFKGYTEYRHGPNGVGLGGSYGILRVMYCHDDYPTCYVPVDVVANATIVVAYDRGMKGLEVPTPFFNIVESETCITWGAALTHANNWLYEHPYSKMMWYPFGRNHDNYFSYRLYTIFLHFIPAYLIDFLLIMLRRKPQMVELYKKADKGVVDYRHFTLNRWSFKNDSLKSLYKHLSDVDQQNFNFDLWNINWYDYIEAYAYGLRTYVAKESEDTYPKGRKLLKKLYILHCLTKFLFYGLVLWFIWTIYEPVFHGFKYVTDAVIFVK